MFGIPTEVLMGLVSTGLGFIMKNAAQKRADLAEERKFSHLTAELQNKMANDAAQRSSPFVRKYAAIFIITVAMLSIIAAGFVPSVDTTVIRDIPQHSLLFGLIKWGKDFEVVSMSGLFQPDWIRFIVCQVVGFLFGSGFAKVTK